MRLLPLILATLATLVLAGCGDDEEAAPAGQAPGGETKLTITIGGEGVAAETIELDCVAEPCDEAVLDQLAAVTAKPDGQRACTMIYGGPEVAHVTGTLRGEPVDREITRADGCGIADYEALFAALGRKPPVADSSATTPLPPADGPTRLTVELSGVEAETIEFDCGGKPCDGAVLEQLRTATNPDPNRPCPELYGGPEVAHVTGTLAGEPVDVTIKRVNGCGVDDYELLFAALGVEPPIAS